MKKCVRLAKFRNLRYWSMLELKRALERVYTNERVDVWAMSNEPDPHCQLWAIDVFKMSPQHIEDEEVKNGTRYI